MRSRETSKAGAAHRAARHAGKSPLGDARARLVVIAALGAVLVALGLAGYHLGRPRATDALPPAIGLPRGAAAGFNVVLFTLDTLRADRLGCYGYEGAQTPTLDALAAGGVQFADAVTAVPMTLPSHSTIMTGSYPPVHGVRDNGTYRLVEKHETLAERLKAKGYATAAFIGAFVLDRRYGLDQGFDLYDDDVTMKYRAPGTLEPSNPERPANIVIDSAIRWLDEYCQSRPGGPFFVWIHLFDPHAPYTPPEPFKTRYASRPYDGEVAFADQQVARFLETLRQRKLFDKTLTVVVGDHGEGLGDHGELEHGLLIYESTMRVPLVFYGPALIPAGRVVDDRVVGTVDVTPTILDLVGLQPDECDGISLLRAGSPSERTMYIETLYPQLKHGWSSLHGLRRHRDKYVEAPTPEYYDLLAEPGENHNLFTEHRDAANTLAKRLKTMMSSFPPDEETSDASVTPDAETLQKLAALGYVGGGVVPGSGPPLDPKEMVLSWQPKFEALRQLVRQGRFEEAIPLLEDALDITPNDPELWLLLSDMQTKAFRFDDAVTSRRKAIELQGGADADEWAQLARLQYAAGDAEAARVSLSQAERLDPDHGESALIRAEQSFHAGQYEEAIRHCEEARRRDPTRLTARSWSLQAQVYDEMGESARAASAHALARESDPLNAAVLLDQAESALREGQFRRALQLTQPILPQHAEWTDARTLAARAYLALGQGDKAVLIMKELADAEPGNAWRHNNLGNVFQELGRLDEAAGCYETALRLDPDLGTAHCNFAWVLENQGRTEEAVRHLRKAVALEPDSETARCELARLLGVRGELDEAIQIIERLLASAPGYAPAYPQAATLFSQQARPGRAIEVLRQGRALFPDDPSIANHLAWLLTTSAEAELRNGAEAVELAELANKLTGGKYSSVLDTLAAAYAEAGRFDEAVAAAKRALELARQAQDDDLASAIEARLDLYRKRKAYHQP